MKNLLQFQLSFYQFLIIYNKNDETNTEVSEFIEENYADDSIDELKNRIMQTEI